MLHSDFFFGIVVGLLLAVLGIITYFWPRNHWPKNDK